MSHISPAASLLWAILSCLFLGFLVLHLWNYDRFQCLKWSAGRQPGTFKRVMTYSYLGTLPLLAIYTVASTIIKYQQGYAVVPGHHSGSPPQIMPKPYQLWPESDQRWLTPLYFVFSMSWALELITHLEELTFWLFLLHQGPGKSDWFASSEYKAWLIGSIASLIGMPLTTLITRSNPLLCESWIFFVGSLGATCTNVLFIYVLWMFPPFMRHVKAEGAEPDVIIRLATFYELNCIRVFFRFMFTIPLLILASDGIQGHHPLNEDLFVTDFMIMLSGLGCMFSSAITLLIFFPRSISKEAGFKSKAPSAHVHSGYISPAHDGYFPTELPPKTPTEYAYTATPTRHSLDSTMTNQLGEPSTPAAWTDEDNAVEQPHAFVQYEDVPYQRRAGHRLSHSRTKSGDMHASTHPNSNTNSPPSERPPQRISRDVVRPPSPNLHPYVLTFTSPIDLLDSSDDRETQPPPRGGV